MGRVVVIVRGESAEVRTLTSFKPLLPPRGSPSNGVVAVVSDEAVEGAVVVPVDVLAPRPLPVSGVVRVILASLMPPRTPSCIIVAVRKLGGGVPYPHVVLAAAEGPLASQCPFLGAVAAAPRAREKYST